MFKVMCVVRKYLCTYFVVKSQFDRDSNPGPLEYRASALPTELLRPDILIDSHTPGYPVTHFPSLRNSFSNAIEGKTEKYLNLVGVIN